MLEFNRYRPRSTARSSRGCARGSSPGWWCSVRSRSPSISHGGSSTRSTDGSSRWSPPASRPTAICPSTFPGIGGSSRLVGLTLLGFLAANIIGRSPGRLSEAILDRTPLVRGVYKGVKQVFETRLQPGRPVPQGRPGGVPDQGHVVDRLRSPPIPALSCRRVARREADDLGVPALHAQSRPPASYFISRPPISSSWRSRPTTPPSSTCRRG